MVQWKTGSNESTRSTAVEDDKVRLTDITILEDRLIGADAIARFLECSPRHVRRLARREGVPIRKPVGDDRFVAFKSKLVEWQQGKSFKVP